MSQQNNKLKLVANALLLTLSPICNSVTMERSPSTISLMFIQTNATLPSISGGLDTVSTPSLHIRGKRHSIALFFNGVLNRVF
mmetsp:Transcript_48299/g.127856  ORF Transcript_48299/g.127856 Transcript_48299/m.127856 type:complete len:83 (-) Transcript_48299:28-276(-)